MLNLLIIPQKSKYYNILTLEFENSNQKAYNKKYRILKDVHIMYSNYNNIDNISKNV